jgi:WS/DGAT/MGAT family acyltransferase
MDEPTNMAMITGVMMFDEPLDLERLKAPLKYRLLAPYPRFRQRVSESSLRIGRPRWETDPTFDLSAHLHRIALPAPGDQSALQDLASDLMSTPLDFSKPLWQIHLVENYGTGCALVVRLHHCIADGLALVQVLLSLTDDTPDAPWPQPLAEMPEIRSPIEALLRPIVSTYNTVTKTVHGAESLVRDGFGLLTSPDRMLAAARLGASGALALGKLLLIGPDQRTIFRGRCGVPKRAVWSGLMPLAEVKAAGKIMDGTVNDVLLSAVAGALRRYLAGRGQPTEGVNIRAMVPVSIRPPEELGKLGNRFGLVILSLPVGIEDPVKRLAVLKRRMDAIKNTPEAFVAFGILSTMGMTPVQIEKIIVSIFARKVTAVMTNVPGPKRPVYLAGVPLKRVMFWVPSPGQLGLGISIISYAGEVIVGVATDTGLVPDPEEIVAGFHAEVEEMKQLLLQVEGEKQREAETAVPTAPDQCQALTKAGKPCRNRALPGTIRCRVHTEK